MNISLRAITKKTALFATAFVLAVSTLTVAVPFIINSPIASAAPDTSYTSDGFESLTWGVDRRLPSGGHAITSSQLTLTVDGDNPAPTTSQRFEGLKAALPAGTTSVSADLYVDPAWSDKTVIAGIWSQANNGTYNAWPTLEFANDGGSAVVEVFNTFGGAIEGVTSVAYGSTINLEIAVNPVTDQFTYYLNDTPIFSSASGDYKPLTSLIFNNFNNGVAGNDYTTVWSNLRVGKQNSVAPSNLRFIDDGTAAVIPEGSVVSDANVTLRWDTVPNADRYQVRVTNPDEFVQSDRQTGWYTFDLNDGTRHGFFGTIEGIWEYEVRTKDATTGVWSEYSTPVTIGYDLVKPEVELLSPLSTVINSTAATLSVKATDNVALGKIVANIYQQGSTTVYKGTSTTVTGISQEAVHTVDLATVIAGNPLPEGNYYVKYNATDKTGRLSSTGNFAFRVDNTNPVVYFQADMGIKIATSNPVAIVSETTPIRLRVEGELNGSMIDKYIYIDGDLVDNYNSDHRNRGYNIDTTTLSDGMHTLTGKGIDEAGNETTSTPIVFVVDNSEPTVKINLNRTSYVTSGSTLGPLQNPEIEAYDTNLDRIELSKGGVVTNTWTTSATSRRANISFLGEGVYTVRAYDRAGNVSDEFVFTVDRTAPVAPVLVRPDIDAFLNGGPVQEWSHENVADVARYVYESYTDASMSSLIHRADNITALQRTIGGSQNIVIWWRVAAVDAVGNMSAFSSLRQLTVDNTNPIVNLDAFSVTPARGTISAVGSVSDNFALENYVVVILDGSTVVSSESVAVTGSLAEAITHSIDTTLLIDGTYTVRISAFDRAGNSNVSVDRPLVVDNTPPAVVVTEGSRSGNVITANVTGETPASFTWVQTTGAAGGVTFNATLLNPEFTVVTDGSYGFTFTAFDAAGNSTAQTFSFTYTTPAPQAETPAITGPADGFTDVAVLGDTTDNDAEAESALGATTDIAAQAADSDANQGKLFGLAWYWWLLILAAIAALAWWIIAAIRRRNEDNEA